MKGHEEGDPALWIRPHDELGRPIDADVLAAARRNWKRVRSYAQNRRHDTSTAAEALEMVVRSLTLLTQRHPRLRAQIRNLDYYIFWGAVHRLDRLASTEPDIKYLGSLDDLQQLSSAQDGTWSWRLEDEVVVKEIMGYMNERTRCLFSLRTMGYSWEDIAKSLGTSAGTVQVQFNRGVARARRHVLGRVHSKTDPTPEQGRSE